MPCPCCGSEDTISINGVITWAHRFDINLSSNKQDMRVFGDSNTYGTTMTCGLNGTVTVGSYCQQNASMGDSGLVLDANVCSVNITGVVNCEAISVADDARTTSGWTYVYTIASINGI